MTFASITASTVKGRDTEELKGAYLSHGVAPAWRDTEERLSWAARQAARAMG